jgi:hypothetical protein
MSRQQLVDESICHLSLTLDETHNLHIRVNLAMADASCSI